MALKLLSQSVNYALGTTSNALQALAKKGLIYFDWVKGVWKELIKKINIKPNNCKNLRKYAKEGSQVYDNYILFRWDTWKSKYDSPIIDLKYNHKTNDYVPWGML